MGNIGKVLMYNFAVVALFIVLAYFMNRWWISLFAFLFIMRQAQEVIPIEIDEEQEEEDNHDE